MSRIYTVVKGNGSHIPEKLVKNDDFLNYIFFDPATGQKFDKENEEIIEKFKEITNIDERCMVTDDRVTSDMGAIAAQHALDAAGVNKEDIDFILVAHNFGDILPGDNRVQVMPSLANKVKHKLGIKNPAVYVHDVINGCPGWVQAMIVADAYIRTGEFKRGLVVGSDVNSRAADPYDRDAMIFADGAGAVVVEGVESDEPVGILTHAGRSDSGIELDYLAMGKSLNKAHNQEDLFIRMQGHKIYMYALSVVPGVVKDSLDKAGLGIDDVNKVLIHQANEKMDEAIVARLLKLYRKKANVAELMPMNINKHGNTSSATIPTLWDQVMKKQIEGHEINSGDILVLCSVGGGMNINSIVYKMP